jgi:hypothetical protein
LSLSLNIVGTHLRRIYAKLGADDRSVAVQRARELQMSIPFLKDGDRAPQRAGTSIFTAVLGRSVLRFCGAPVARITMIR